MDGLQKITCDMSEINKNTKVGLTFGQIITVIVVVFSFTVAYANLMTRVVNLENQYLEMKTTFGKQDDVNKSLLRSQSEIRETLIRIEGKFDLKQDRFK